MALKEVGMGLSPKEREILKELQDKVTELATLVNELKTKYNTHTHTENTAATYTQNATTTAPSNQVTNPDITI